MTLTTLAAPVSHCEPGLRLQYVLFCYLLDQHFLIGTSAHVCFTGVHRHVQVSYNLCLQIWDVFFELCTVFAAQECLQLEKHSDLRRKKLFREFVVPHSLITHSLAHSSFQVWRHAVDAWQTRESDVDKIRRQKRKLYTASDRTIP